MATFIEPLIQLDDYDAFRSLMPTDLPDTHDKWLNFQNQKTMPLVMVGHAIKRVEVKPDKFAAHCRTTGTDHNFDNLRAFAELIDRRTNRKP